MFAPRNFLCLEQRSPLGYIFLSSSDRTQNAFPSTCDLWYRVDLSLGASRIACPSPDSTVVKIDAVLDNISGGGQHFNSAVALDS